MKSQVNMTRNNNAPRHHIYIMESHITFLSQHVVTKLHAMKFIYLLYFFNKKLLMPFTLMYMFVNYICTRYVNAHIHKRLNPISRGSTSRS
jgi:hypothetical protein